MKEQTVGKPLLTLRRVSVWDSVIIDIYIDELESSRKVTLYRLRQRKKT